jgi:hypothetical protein
MVKNAASKAGIKRLEHYRWLEKYPGYRKIFEELRRDIGDDLESIAVERATVGWLEPVRYKGKVCGHIRRYDDGLLQFLLRGMMPEKYGVHRRQVAAPQGTPAQSKIEVVFVKPESLRPGLTPLAPRWRRWPHVLEG